MADSGGVKLTEDDVRAVRRRYIPRHRQHGRNAMAREYGVRGETIAKAIWGLTWRQVEDDVTDQAAV